MTMSALETGESAHAQEKEIETTLDGRETARAPETESETVRRRREAIIHHLHRRAPRTDHTTETRRLPQADRIVRGMLHRRSQVSPSSCRIYRISNLRLPRRVLIRRT